MKDRLKDFMTHHYYVIIYFHYVIMNNNVTWRNIQPVKVTSTDDDGKATGKSFREQMKEKCIEYMDQGTEWRFLLVNQSQPFCFLANQNPLILSKRDRNVCHLFEWIFCWRNWTAKNMERINLGLFWNFSPELSKIAILWRLVQGGLPC